MCVREREREGGWERGGGREGERGAREGARAREGEGERGREREYFLHKERTKKYTNTFKKYKLQHETFR